MLTTAHPSYLRTLLIPAGAQDGDREGWNLRPALPRPRDKDHLERVPGHPFLGAVEIGPRLPQQEVERPTERHREARPRPHARVALCARGYMLLGASYGWPTRRSADRHPISVATSRPHSAAPPDATRDSLQSQRRRAGAGAESSPLSEQCCRQYVVVSIERPMQLLLTCDMN